MAILKELTAEEELNMNLKSAQQIKEDGNNYFSKGDYDKALSAYTQALSIDKADAPNLNVYRKNRAACFLKLKRYQEAVDDCTLVLETTPGDPKALFRRCQAYEALESLEKAYKDAILLIKIDPKNTAIMPIIQRLNPIIQKKVQKVNSTDNKVTEMFEIAFDAKIDMEKRKQAANNLIVLARERSGAARIIIEDVDLNQLKRLLKDTQIELRLAAMRVLACLSDNDKPRALSVMKSLTLKIICIHIGSGNEEMSTASTHLLKNIINSVTSIDNYCKERDEYELKRKSDYNSKMRPYPFICEKLDEEAVKHMDYVFPALITMLGHGKVSQYGRDAAMELILKFVTRKDGAGWSKKFIEAEGLQRLLEVAGTITEHKTLQISVNTRMHASLCLSKIFDDLSCDKEREIYKESINIYFNDMFGDQIMESKLEAVMAMSALLQGPIEVGNMVLAREGVVEILLAMTEGGDTIHVKYAIEALVHATSKKNRCTGVIKQATPILKKLYTNSKDSIKVRALVGLCKLGSFGGNDASSKTYADGSTQTLSKACRRFLMNVDKDVDIRKWASEGLAYLTLDADVKDDLCNDTDAVNSLLDLAKIKDKGILYPVGQILVNCTNSYDKLEVEKELIELAKFSKQHVPEEHEKDGEVFIKERIEKLLKTGVVNALVYLSNTESESSREQLSRVYLALVMDQSHRGLIVQQGGAKALIPLANKGNFVGKAIAAQALAKIAITQDPNIAFPGQRAYEVIRPILQLLAIEKTAIQNFEALLALTNLASMSESVRLRIIKDDGIQMIEHYLYEEHDELRRAATECFCNLVQSEEVAKLFQGENDRIKLMVLFSGEEDQKLVLAASGCLAILSTEDPICEKIVKATTQWRAILQQLLVTEDTAIQHRGAYIVRNMIFVSKELADTVLDDDLFKLLMALSKVGGIAEETQKLSKESLDRAVEWGIIKPLDN